MAERSVSINSFRGLNDFGIPETDPSTTRSLNAVLTRNGRIVGAPGFQKFDSITASSASAIIKVMPFYAANLATTLYRMTPTAIHQHNISTHAWDDVTGTALNGFDYSRPQFVVHKDTLVFVNEGADRPRKLTGSGNSAVLGGTPPYAKAIWQGWGYLFLGNVSSDGVTFDPRGAIYSDEFDSNWDLCAGNTLAFNETNGAIVVGGAVGQVVVVGKTDALIRLSFVGDLARFGQEKIAHSQGVLAPASWKILDDLGVAVFLATDHRLQFCNGNKVDTVPPFVQKKLDDTMDHGEAAWAWGEVYPDKDFYSLFYTAKGDAGNMNQILLNFRTGEFNHRIYPSHAFTCGAVARRGTENRFYLASSTLVYEESFTWPTADGEKIDRFYDIDWNSFGLQGEKYLKGVEFNCMHRPGGRISISVAADGDDTLLFEKVFSVRNQPRTGQYAKISYRIDPGLRGREHKIRIKLLHDETGAPVEIIPAANIIYEPISQGGTSLEQNAARTPSNITE